MAPLTFDQLLGSMGRIEDAETTGDPTSATIAAGAARLMSLPAVNADALASLVSENPDWIRVLGLAVGLGQEQLQIHLYQWFHTRSYRIVARQAEAVVARLDELGLVVRISEERSRTYSYSDLLVERYGSRARAGRAIGRGRALENSVEAIVSGLGLPYAMRTRFAGAGGRTAPCDLAIPSGGGEAQIVVGIKGFNSTGSKLTDARREIEEMTLIRLPRQYVFAVVDGTGWLSRQPDLRRIWDLLNRHDIDGVYTQTTLDQLRVDLADAAQRRGITAAQPGGD